MNYYQDDNPFLEPSVHYLGRDGTGKTVSEFPIIYYSVAQLWKLFGHHEFMYRIVVLLFFLFGLLALFKILEQLLKDSILSITGTLLMFTSPTLVYYANNFLMDIPAFSLALVGLYFFYKFYNSSASTHLYLMVLFYTLAGLLKASSLLSFMAIIGIYFIDRFNISLKPDGKIFKIPLVQFVPIVSVLIVQFLWYSYARTYNASNNSGIFLIGIMPIWELTYNEIITVYHEIIKHIRWDYFRRITQAVLVLMFLSALIFYNRINKTFLFLSIFISFGFLLFVLLFYEALHRHDYYTINLFVLAPLVIICFFLMLEKRFNRFYTSIFLRIIFIAFLIHNIDFARRRIENRYHENSRANFKYVNYIRPLEKITPYLRTIGIEKEDRIVCISDNSINTSLYYMNQKGWTNYGLFYDSIRIRKRIKLGAKYLIIYKEETYRKKGVKPFVRNKMGEFENFKIYSLQE